MLSAVAAPIGVWWVLCRRIPQIVQLRTKTEAVDDIKEIWASGFKALVENNRIVRYRVAVKVTFVLKR
jgi:predicted RNase H-like HicB family nuclease